MDQSFPDTTTTIHTTYCQRASNDASVPKTALGAAVWDWRNPRNGEDAAEASNLPFYLRQSSELPRFIHSFTMRLSLIYIALALVGVSAEPIAIGRREAKGKDPVPAQLTSQNGTYHYLEKRFDDCRFTYYAAGLGSCGHTNTDNDFIVALNAAQYAGGSHCGQSITITYGGKSAQAKIMDLCPGCPYGGLDLTPALFAHFDNLDKGVITGSWVFGAGSEAKAAVVKATTTSTPKPKPTTTSTSTRRATSTTTRTTSTTSTRAPITSRIAIPTASTTPTTTSTSSTSTRPATTASSNVAGAAAKPQVSSLIDVINAAVLSLGQLAVAAAQANN
ncbi:hypothetical protein EYR40_001070 [Pleurotus pulmonarius]|nr:hypothetical protein EYR38_004313 [Pleurotus pulmonarius]KAF4608723.1 hypothetical protein EYR40_001070 [Pleurotus pulmonarius]